MVNKYVTYYKLPTVFRGICLIKSNTFRVNFINILIKLINM